MSRTVSEPPRQQGRGRSVRAGRAAVVPMRRIEGSLPWPDRAMRFESVRVSLCNGQEMLQRRCGMKEADVEGGFVAVTQ
jgi:hypothetical protein